MPAGRLNCWCHKHRFGMLKQCDTAISFRDFWGDLREDDVDDADDDADADSNDCESRGVEHHDEHWNIRTMGPCYLC